MAFIISLTTPGLEHIWRRILRDQKIILRWTRSPNLSQLQGICPEALKLNGSQIERTLGSRFSAGPYPDDRVEPPLSDNRDR